MCDKSNASPNEKQNPTANMTNMHGHMQVTMQANNENAWAHASNHANYACGGHHVPSRTLQKINGKLTTSSRIDEEFRFNHVSFKIIIYFEIIAKWFN